MLYYLPRRNSPSGEEQSPCFVRNAVSNKLTESSASALVAVSPRRKGVKQGSLLLLSGAVIVPILAMFASFSTFVLPQMLAALAAIICFIGGPLRMFYA